MKNAMTAISWPVMVAVHFARRKWPEAVALAERAARREQVEQAEQGVENGKEGGRRV
jgi:hypothetical protein